MTGYTVYAMICTTLFMFLTPIAMLIVWAFFGAQRICPVALVGFVAFMAFWVWGTLTMQQRKGQS